MTSDVSGAKNGRGQWVNLMRQTHREFLVHGKTMENLKHCVDYYGLIYNIKVTRGLFLCPTLIAYWWSPSYCRSNHSQLVAVLIFLAKGYSATVPSRGICLQTDVTQSN